MIPITLVTPLLGDGFSDFERHMLSFNVLMDLSILLLLGHMTALIFGGVINRHGAEKGSSGYLEFSLAQIRNPRDRIRRLRRFERS